MNVVRRLPWKVIVLATRLHNRIRYVLNVPRVFRNRWAWPLPKLGFNTILELRNGLRFSVRGGTHDLGVLNEAVIINPYLGAGHISLRRDGVVVDVGANIGDFTVIAASLCPLGRVYAIEPLSEYIPLLNTNKLLNSLFNVEMIQTALGDHDGTIELSLAGCQSTTRFDDASDTETVNLTTIPLLMRNYKRVIGRVKKLAALLRESGYEVWYTKGPWTGLLWARRPDSALACVGTSEFS